MHFTARRLLVALPDGTLGPKRESQVREHLSGCKRCQNRWSEIQIAESLLQRIPLSILPLETNPSSHGRLSRLARWSEEPALPEPERWRVPTLSVVALLACLFVAVGFGRWSPIQAETSQPVNLAYLPQDSQILPVVWRPGP